MQLFRASDGALLRTFAGDANGFVESVAFSSSGATLLASSPYTHEIRFFDVTSGAELQLFDHETGWGPAIQLPLATSPDGAWFGYGRGDSTVVLAHNPLP